MDDFPALELLHDAFFNVLADIQRQEKDIIETGVTMQRYLVITQIFPKVIGGETAYHHVAEKILDYVVTVFVQLLLKEFVLIELLLLLPDGVSDIGHGPDQFLTFNGF